MARRAQHPGGSRGRGGDADDPQCAEPLLRATALDRDAALAGRYRQVFDGLTTAVALLDNNFLITELNPAAENLLGVSQSRALGQPLLPLLGDDEEIQFILTRTLESGVSYATELTLSRSEVHPYNRIVDCRVSPLSGHVPDGGLLVEMSDVTRRSRISRENALIIQHGAGRQMIRQLAHEIKNPLGGLRGAAQLLERQLADEDLKEYTSVIISEADRLAQLVDTLLGPGGSPDKKPANIHELLEYVVRVVQPEVGQTLTIVRDYDPGLPNLSLDRDQLVQALLNLVTNAITALDNHGTLLLRTRAIMNFTIGDLRHGAVASIEIEDDGPGIPEGLQDSVFYPLITGRADGTGLGLPVAQELISRHGGLIEFESRPGRTVFFVRIPLEAAA